MTNYCTLFDSKYLTRGLAMYHSLMATGDDVTLYIFCFDDLTFNIVQGLQLPHVVAVSLAEFESDEVLRVKSDRSPGEYCWTCTPHVIGYCLDQLSLPQITYLDADIYFLGKPSQLLEELASSGKSVLITDHRYAPPYEQAYKAGIYCVQFITFTADDLGLKVLNWWKARCLEWCYARFEDGKFGDQKYLDDWPVRFKGIHVLEHSGGGVAPWNVQKCKLHFIEGKPFVDEQPFIFYHFHQYRFFQDGIHDLCDYYRLSKNVVEMLYRPYIKALHDAQMEARSISPGFSYGYDVRDSSIITWLLSIYRRLKGTYNVYRSI